VKQIQITFLVLFFLITGTSTVFCQSSEIDSIANSHIEANVPNDQDFGNLLKRDLAAHFKKALGKDVSIGYELLRNVPTQSGAAFPKFYAWIVIKEKDTLIEDGAVRLAAIEKKQFEIIDYLKRADIEKDADQIYKVFPRPIGDKIKEKINK
jgi:hypothetical protein